MTALPVTRPLMTNAGIPSLSRKSSGFLTFWKKSQKVRADKIPESDILLPTEVWLYIIAFISELALDSISRVCKRLRWLTLPLFLRSQQIFPFMETFAFRRLNMSTELAGYRERSLQRIKFLSSTPISSAVRDFYVSPYPPGYNRRHRVEHKPVEEIMESLVNALPRFQNLNKLVLHLPICDDTLRSSLRLMTLDHLELEMPPTATGEIPIPARKQFMLNCNTSPIQLFLPESLSLVLLFSDSIECIVSGPTGTDTIVRTLLRHPQGLPSLQTVDLSMRFAASPFFAAALAACPALTFLRLRSSPIDGSLIPNAISPLPSTTIPLLQTYHGPAAYATAIARGRPLLRAHLWTSHGVSTVLSPEALLPVLPVLPNTLISLSLGVTLVSTALLHTISVAFPHLQTLSVNAHLDVFHPGTVTHHVLRREIRMCLPAALQQLPKLTELRIGAQLAGLSSTELFESAQDVMHTFPQGYDPTSWRRWIVDRPWYCVRWVRDNVSVSGDADINAAKNIPSAVEGELLVVYAEHYFHNFERGSRISGRAVDEAILRIS